jgi:hypothetical protein
VLVLQASGNVQNTPAGLWSDVAIDAAGHLAMVAEIRSTFCTPSCPSGELQLGLAYTADLFAYETDRVLRELTALVASAKANGFYFKIHANHEWVLPRNINPFGVPAESWAEFTDWDTPLTRFYVAWSAPPFPEIGLKPNFESPFVRARVREDIAVVSAFVRDRVLADPAAAALFLGLDCSWETEVTPWVSQDGLASGPLGFAALELRGFSPAAPPADLEAELGNIARDYLAFVAGEYERNGIPKAMLLTHIVGIADPVRAKTNPLDAARVIGIGLGVSAFGGGFDFPRIGSLLTNGAWAIAETDPGSVMSVIDGQGTTPPPYFITVYAWGDTVRPGTTGNTNAVSAFQSLFASR